jgi:branched-chain amino acid transport system substrate-binding protein
MPRHRTGRAHQAWLCQPAIGAAGGLRRGRQFHPVELRATEVAANFEVIVKDSQSNPNRAAEVAKELIIDDEVDMMLVASTPETTNPVATTCEAEGVPVISTVAPWQPWFIGQQGNPGDPGSTAGNRSTTAYHFFWGLEDVISVFTAMWASSTPTSRSAACSPMTATAMPGAIRMSASRRCWTSRATR